MLLNLLFKKVTYILISCLLSVACVSQSLAEDLFLKNSAGNVIAQYSIPQNKNFAIRYIHSVAQTPIEDYFSLKNGKIILDKTVYQDFGAGLPHKPEDGQSMRLENGLIVIQGFNKEFSSFDLRVGRVARHTLLIPAEKNITASKSEKAAKLISEIPLDSLASQGDSITFTAGN